ncbi:hypothetical protein JOD29_000554 [Lysinibacillus composti]|uniref:DUF2642 domain-containing protein n=1 Tax=Lysinibacillus composti TaxID=720633 RepID=A0A3N9UUK1_9BACI|nr:DUF2642 domain-containing protein [Lysinibacillus composti]MBM7607317.1 hypothetical protein [Lysinibacillus composti]RQW76112.1 DUF2642 domain-containing protein [Lysinibacillus composti]
MYNIFSQVIKETVKITLAGQIFFNGSIIDLSKEIVVLFNGKDYIYIPMEHIENVSVDQDEEIIQQPTNFPSVISKDDKNDFSLTYMLNEAIGMYTEIYVANKQPIHGTITQVQSNYFVFHSPIYKTMYIATKHLKWLIPYTENQKPYTLTDDELKVSAKKGILPQHFEHLVHSMRDKLVVVNQGEKPYHIGKISKVHGAIIELQTARTNTTYLNLEHIKTIHES